MDEIINGWAEKYLNDKYSKDFEDIKKLLIEAFSAGVVEGVKEGKAIAKENMIKLLQGEDK